MNRPKVFLAHPIPNEVEEYIGKYCDYEKWDSEDIIPLEVLLDKIKDKDGVILEFFEINEEFLKHAPNLKVVANTSVGYNNFDIEAMKGREVIGTHTPYVLDDTVADLIIGLILAAARRIPELDRYVKEGNWSMGDYKNLFGVDFHHSTVGIIGMGRIGEAVAKRARLGFSAEVLYYNRKRKTELEEKLGVMYCEMDELLRRSDFVVLMTPLTDETYHLIDRDSFDKMKNNAIFINASRGKTVNERALVEALKSKRILGAGLDVFEIEPVEKDNEILKLKNVVTVPHIGSATEKATFDITQRAAENLVMALTEGSAPNIVPELKF